MECILYFRSVENKSKFTLLTLRDAGDKKEKW